MNNIGRNKLLWLTKQGCVLKEVFDPFCNENNTVVYNKYNDYVTLADLGDNSTVNFIYKHRLTDIQSVSTALGRTEEERKHHGCNSVELGFNEKEQAWYGFCQRGYAKFYIGYEVVQGSIADANWHRYPFKIENLDQAKMMAVDFVEELG